MYDNWGPISSPGYSVSNDKRNLHSWELRMDKELLAADELKIKAVYLWYIAAAVNVPAAYDQQSQWVKW